MKEIRSPLARNRWYSSTFCHWSNPSQSGTWASRLLLMLVEETELLVVADGSRTRLDEKLRHPCCEQAPRTFAQGCGHALGVVRRVDGDESDCSVAALEEVKARRVNPTTIAMARQNLQHFVPFQPL